MICPYCNSQINDDDTFCQFCGNTVAQSSAAQNVQYDLVQNTQYTQPKNTQYAQPQNTPYQPPVTPYQNGNAQAPAAKGPNGLLIFSLVIVIGLLLIAAVLLFIKPGYLTHSNDDSSSSKSSKSVTTTAKKTEKKTSKRKTDESSEREKVTTAPVDDSSQAEEVITTAPVTTTTAPETTEKKTTTTKKTEAETTTTTKKTTTQTTTTKKQTTTSKPAATTKSAEDIRIEENNSVYEEAMNYSTYTRPAFDEFEWCFGQSGLVYEPPGGAQMVTNPLGYTGGWKAMIIYNPSNYDGTFIRELDNIDIGVYEDSVILTIDWYFMDIDSAESYNEEDMEDTNFFGSVTDTGIYVSGDAEISINSLWKADGKEYALGTLTTSDGLPAYLAMVR